MNSTLGSVVPLAMFLNIQKVKNSGEMCHSEAKASCPVWQQLTETRKAGIYVKMYVKISSCGNFPHIAKNIVGLEFLLKVSQGGNLPINAKNKI